MTPTTKMSYRKPRSTVNPVMPFLCVAVLVFAQTLALGALMSFQVLAQRLPPASNAIVAINVTKVLASPYGKREHWGSNIAEAWAKQPVMIPPGALRMIMAANVKTSTMDSYWEMSLMEMEKMPSIQDLADKEGGHIDRVWDKDAAYSPINAYYVPIEPKVLASITPAERSEIARWVRQPVKPEGVVTSEYIKGVVTRLTENTDIVMAIDLEGAWGLPVVRRFLDGAEIAEITPDRMNPTVQTLGSIKGITLDITVGESVNGRATVTFDRDAAVLATSAKPVMLAVLQRMGMRTDDVQTWTFAVTGKQVSMQGPLSSTGLRELLGMVQSPIPAATVAAAAPAAGQTSAAVNPAAASQRYFKTVDAIIKGLKEGSSVKATGTTFRNSAKRIEQLPILGVDPALVEWGTLASTKLKEAAAVLGVGQLQIDSRVQGVQDPEYIGYTYDEFGNANTNTNVAINNISRQRRQLADEQKAQTYEQALGILNEFPGITAKIRTEMVAKYNVEF